MKRLILSVALGIISLSLTACPSDDKKAVTFKSKACGVLETETVFICNSPFSLFCGTVQTPVIANYNQLVNGQVRLTVLQIPANSALNAWVNDHLNDFEQYEVCAHSTQDIAPYAGQEIMSPQVITIQDSFVNSKVVINRGAKAVAIRDLNDRARATAR